VFLFSLMFSDKRALANWDELYVRSNTGLGGREPRTSDDRPKSTGPFRGAPAFPWAGAPRRIIEPCHPHEHAGNFHHGPRSLDDGALRRHAPFDAMQESHLAFSSRD